MKFEDINWEDPKCMISKHFSVHEALYLPSWSCHHIPTDAEKHDIFHTAQVMDLIREFINLPISVSVWIRPTHVNQPKFDPKSIKIDPKDPKKDMKEKALKDLNYNVFIGSTAIKSAHILGKACDFTVKGMDCDEVRKRLVPKIDEFKIRIERLDHSPWIHCDTQWIQGGTNYFIP